MQTTLRSEINITPLIDIVLVLLIVFIALLPAWVRGYTPRIPVLAPGPAPLDPVQGPPVLALGTEGRLKLDGEPVEAAALEPALRAALSRRALEDRRLIVKADGDLPFQQPVDLLARVHQLDPKLPVVLR